VCSQPFTQQISHHVRRTFEQKRPRQRRGTAAHAQMRSGTAAAFAARKPRFARRSQRRSACGGALQESGNQLPSSDSPELCVPSTEATSFPDSRGPEKGAGLWYHRRRSAHRRVAFSGKPKRGNAPRFRGGLGCGSGRTAQNAEATKHVTINYVGGQAAFANENRYCSKRSNA
jgi:hypothetical protein